MPKKGTILVKAITYYPVYAKGYHNTQCERCDKVTDVFPLNVEGWAYRFLCWNCCDAVMSYDDSHTGIHLLTPRD